jgi:hypothetical protein
METETFTSNTPLFKEQIGGARNQSKTVMTYVTDKIQNVMTIDNKTLLQFLEHTEYLTITIAISYFYSRLLDNLFPIQRSFSTEKLSLDLALHLITLSIGFFLLPKVIQIIPSIMHGSTSFSTYQTDSYKGAFVGIFLGLFSYSSLRKKIGNLVRGNIPLELFKESDNYRLDEKPVVDEKTRIPKGTVKKQQLSTPTQKFPTTSPVPTVNPMNTLQMLGTQYGSGFGRPQNTRDESVKDGNDIRNFLQNSQNNEYQQQEGMNNMMEQYETNNDEFQLPEHEYGSIDSVAMFAESAGMSGSPSFAPF